MSKGVRQYMVTMYCLTRSTSQRKSRQPKSRQRKSRQRKSSQRKRFTSRKYHGIFGKWLDNSDEAALRKKVEESLANNMKKALENKDRVWIEFFSKMNSLYSLSEKEDHAKTVISDLLNKFKYKEFYDAANNTYKYVTDSDFKRKMKGSRNEKMYIDISHTISDRNIIKLMGDFNKTDKSIKDDNPDTFDVFGTPIPIKEITPPYYY